MSSSGVRYLVFDVETVADGALVSKLRYPGEKLSPTAAIKKYRAELMEQFENDFIPYTFQIPLCIAVAKISAEYELTDLVLLDDPAFRPHVMTEHFWRGWEKYKKPTFVTFNGRGYDIPLLELAAFRYGVSVPAWFAGGKAYDQPRNRYNTSAHLDLYDTMTNFGAARFTGGLNLAANLLGKPGKMSVQGDMVQDLADAGDCGAIRDYCRCDVLDTYFVFLRSRVLVGELTLKQEHQLILDTKKWIEGESKKIPAYKEYLENWGDWHNPWE